ncbi:Enamine deaminase RidA, house cleaning of reactive enamine intermediates, YjgF/YER057c/UK114 family [Microlunatus flavus]|uniref:Enamine deaminase RidA, house cleaning of reactive enamine intermediates, YjgF/YER057c/UK114 family n=1 Tax=Microlunatus flavus TaxID=1036181 RepID=A0A1H9FUB1_9ACTN|nr:Enamine deaminase RidA, house cleaning of reactive enamine intermediates, YjgF/YER057c/UK114 family [Microlunatus flavus]
MSAVVLAGLLGVAYDLGIRVNVQTRSVPVPTAALSPEDVVRAYVEAYDHRDFTTTSAIYPNGQAAFSRFRAMGTIRHLTIVESRVATSADLAGTFPEAGHSYYRVQVSFDYTGLTGSDLAVDDGPSGSTYWLERSSADRPWTIADEGFKVGLLRSSVRRRESDMPRQPISTPLAPSSPMFSQGVRSGPHLFVSGTTGIDPRTGEPAGTTIQAQLRQALVNCRAVLDAGGASLDDVVEVGILLADPEDFAGLNEEYAHWFPTDPPTRYVARLGPVVPGLLVSVRMTAITT